MSFACASIPTEYIVFAAFQAFSLCQLQSFQLLEHHFVLDQLRIPGRFRHQGRGDFLPR